MLNFQNVSCSYKEPQHHKSNKVRKFFEESEGSDISLSSNSLSENSSGTGENARKCSKANTNIPSVIYRLQNQDRTAVIPDQALQIQYAYVT